ncbi:hypothetical protein ACIBQ1_09510 [Nonomuraea sp. NPDC050153]|uniref:LexA family protein n=1 Tax=Nonomuraea sp. NPDC050153 TaxID=3364359 RepID=UPI0037B3C312
MTEVTARQLRILRAVSAHIEENGFPPSTVWIGKAAGLSSDSSVMHQLGQLTAKGLLVRAPRTPRGLAQVLTPGVVTVPVVWCEPCGSELPADHFCPARRAEFEHGSPSDLDSPA